MAMRVMPGLLYGPDHAYGNPLSGSGTEESVGKIRTGDLVEFHDTWFKPNNASLVIVGDVTMEEIKPKLERLFSNWDRDSIPKKNVGSVEHRSKPELYLIDKPGTPTTVIFAGHVAPPKANPNEIAIETMNNILGGVFTSRINMNLREDKHWSYGSGSMLFDARFQRPFLAYGLVQTDKASESMMEIEKELKEIISVRPPTADELNKVIDNRVLGLPGLWETNSSVAGSISDIVTYGYPDNYFDTYASKVRNLAVGDVADAAVEVIHPDNLIWIVVTDLAKTGEKIKALGFDIIHYIDADGNPVK